MKKGGTLVRYMDGSRVADLRARLRSPMRRAPGFTHSLHDLWDAYLALEAEHLELWQRVEEARKALDS